MIEIGALQNAIVSGYDMIVCDHFQVPMFNADLASKQISIRTNFVPFKNSLTSALGAAVFTIVLSALGRRKNWKPRPSTAKPGSCERRARICTCEHEVNMLLILVYN